MDKAKINKFVKKIKKIREESKRKALEPKKADFAYQVSGKEEKALMGAGIAAGLAILFDDSRKKPKKRRKFLKRALSWYKTVGGMLDATVAQQLAIDAAREFQDEKLENLEIENAVKFDL